MKYLFNISVGPVQDFIAAARRTRDLWFGSHLLSELTKAAAAEIYKHPGTDLIFPSIESKNDLAPISPITLANKILAVIETQDPRQIGASVKQAIQDRLIEISDETFKNHHGAFDEAKAKAQLLDLPEIYWAAVPYDGANYLQARTDVDELLADRKNTRNFNPTDKWAGSEYKSSLDGLRESVISVDGYSKLENKGIKNNERLCGVGLLKRLRNPDININSTSHIAAMPLILSINKNNKEAIERYVKSLDGLGIDNSAFYPPKNRYSDVFEYDGHILFDSQFKEFFDKYIGDEQKQKITVAKSALREFLEQIDAPSPPSPYYAILLADGDNMGKLISGYTDSKDHKALSAALRKFVKDANIIVENNNGALIYAGGDDVLAMLPLTNIVQSAIDLSNSFKNSTKGRGIESTLSVGIAIAHMFDPLQDVLNLAREAEKEAKTIKNKNGMCIKVDKRSGTVTTVKGKFGELDQRLHLFRDLQADKEFPAKAAYELRQLAEDLRYFEPQDIIDAYKRESIRILNRKRKTQSDTALESSVISSITNCMKFDPANAYDGMKSIADEMIVSRMLIDKYR